MTSEEKELLIRIDEKLTNLVGLYRTHTEEDNQRFDKLYKESDMVKKVLYGGFGAFFILQVIFNWGIIDVKTKDRYYKSEAKSDFSKVNDRINQLENKETK